MLTDGKYDDLVRKKSVLCMQSALARSGLTTGNLDFMDIWTTYKSIDGITAGVVRYLYNNNIDFSYELSREKTNPLLLCPSKERALVECIKCEKWCDEGVLIEAMKNYLWAFKDMDKLYEVADHFKVPRSKIDYWVKEAEEDEDL